MKRTFKLARKMRHEMVSLAFVVSLPLFLVAVFPFKALSGKQLPAVSAMPKTEFRLVSLSMKQEKEFLATARSAWQTKHQTLSAISLDVPMDLPEIEPDKLESRFTIDTARQFPHEDYVFVFYPATEALGAPEQLSADVSYRVKELPFSKSELTTLPE